MLSYQKRKSKINEEHRTMAKRTSTPTATVASDATGGQDSPGVTTEVYTFIDPSGAPDEMFDAMVTIVCSPIIA
jgi:hypothetical protein